MKDGEMGGVKMRTSIVMALLLLVLAVAGCGGGEGESTTASAKAFKSEANAICKQTVGEWAALYRKVSAEYEDANNMPDSTRAKILADAIMLPPTEKLVAGLSDLQAPASKSAEIERVVSSFQAVVDKGKANPEEIGNGQLLYEARKEAEAAGLKSCGP
jgi:hypothetical protein